MKFSYLYIFILAVAFIPFFANAQLFNPDEGLVKGICDDGQVDSRCQFSHIVLLVTRAINFMFYVSVPVAALLFAYAGFLFLTAGPNPSQAERARRIFTNVAVGFVIMLAAWLIVYTVSDALIKDDFFGDSLPQLRK